MPRTINYGLRASEKKILFLNRSKQVCPAYSPVVFTWDNDASTPQPWVKDETLLDGRRLAFPATGADMSETGYALTLYAINGPVDVQPDCYGYCSVDYPLPVLYDPNSFPIPIDPSNPSAGTNAGTWQEYITVYPGDIEGPPLLGFVSANSRDPTATKEAAASVNGSSWKPASFMADFILWTVLYWFPKEDGSRSDNIAIVVPAGPVGEIPIASTVVARTAGEVQAIEDEPIELLQPNGSFTIEKPGLYRLAFSGTVEIQSPGVSVTVRLQATWGPAWLDESGNPLTQGTQILGGLNQIPVPGETITLASSGRASPAIHLTADVGVGGSSLIAGSGNDTLPVSGSLEFTLTFDEYGFGPVTFETYVYLRKGDILTVDATAKGNALPVTIEVDGALAYQKVSTNQSGSFPILY